MAEIWQGIRQSSGRLLAYVWRYLGTVAALGLMLGVMGMGLYHVFHPGDDDPAIRCFTGLCNPAEALPPSGLGEIPRLSGDAAETPHIRFEYAPDSGRLLRVVHVDARGHLSPMPGSSVAEQRLEYDADGRLTARRNRDAHGRPAADSSGVASREFRYNAEGLLTGRILRDAAGRKVVPRMPGYAEERIRRDALGRPLVVEYLDGAGKPITNANGESVVRYTYNDKQHETTRANYVNGQLADNAQGVATELERRSADGHTYHTSWLNAAGQVVHSLAHEADAILEEHRPAEKMRRFRRCRADGGLVDSGRIWAEHIVRNTPTGAVEWECFNGSDGLPCLNPSCGYAERVCEYADDGSLQREYFWDAAGNPSPCYEKRHSSSHVISLHTDGSTELRSKSP